LLLAGHHPRLGFSAVLAFVVVWGATAPLSNQLVPILLVEAVGMRHFGTLIGISYLLYGLAMAAGPLVAGRIYDSTHGYGWAVNALAVVMALALVPTALIRRNPVVASKVAI